MAGVRRVAEDDEDGPVALDGDRLVGFLRDVFRKK
jgi:hypothetical protein